MAPVVLRLLGLLIKDYYEVQTEVPVSDLPRKGDILVVRRQAGPAPPFRGLWSHLAEWNVLEFKGPTDGPEEDDLELLAHVGTGITYRLNEERRARGEPALANRQVSFWYLASTLGETFLGHARGRMALDYQSDGLWRGGVWGHPVWLLSYRDVPVEEDTIPLHLLDREPPSPRSLGELVMEDQELLRRFATWLRALQPGLWREVRHMAGKSSGIIDWEADRRGRHPRGNRRDHSGSGRQACSRHCGSAEGHRDRGVGPGHRGRGAPGRHQGRGRTRGDRGRGRTRGDRGRGAPGRHQGRGRTRGDRGRRAPGASSRPWAYPR